jgi:uncharacterized protein
MTNSGKSRIDAVDALRGFALVGVCLAHMIEQYAGSALTGEILQTATAGLLDKILFGIDQVLIVGKFYLLFSLLFGLSFFIQIDNLAQRGEPFHGRFAWRLAILFVFGYLHHLFYRGDILMLYAVLGILLLPLHRLSTRTLMMIAIAMFLGLGRYISFGLWGDVLPLMLPDDPENIAYFNILKHGSLWDVFAINNIGGLKNLIAFLFGIIGRGYVTFGLFLVGICLGRSGFFKNLGAHKPLVKKVLWWGIGLSVLNVAITFACFSLVAQPPGLSTWIEAIALTFYDLFNLSVGAVFCCAFLLAVLRTKGETIVGAFAPYGRMALSNYLLQALIGTTLFYGWGFGRIGEWPVRYLLLTGLCIAAAQMALSRVWLKHYHYGPCEWLWRALTLRRRVKFRRQHETAAAADPATE